jgi:hypothetical protein
MKRKLDRNSAKIVKWIGIKPKVNRRRLGQFLVKKGNRVPGFTHLIFGQDFDGAREEVIAHFKIT